ncbi:HK97 gp10 family phage protein [Actinomadura nitritigenes]|uniref:HK97 gp10 family phage protein n=1 Tax=Actinomadura nitritigenes TaxID=134602 RepID=UPI003D8EAA2D
MPGSPSYELRKLVKDLGKIPADYRKEVRPELRKAAQPLVARVKSNAAWSKRIPPATKLSISLAGRNPGVRVVVDPKRAPHGYYYENDGKQGFFKHPLFGNRRHWYPQRARPFFFDPLESGAAEVADDLSNIVTLAAVRHGFR